MRLLNISNSAINFIYGDKSVTLEQGDSFEFDAFQLNKLTDIRKMIELGWVTLFDEEDFDDVVPDSVFNYINKSKTTKNSMFKNVDFDKEIE